MKVQAGENDATITTHPPYNAYRSPGMSKNVTIRNMKQNIITNR